MTVDADIVAIVDELVESFVNGNRSVVCEEILAMPTGKAALVAAMVQQELNQIRPEQGDSFLRALSFRVQPE